MGNQGVDVLVYADDLVCCSNSREELKRSVNC